MLHSPRCHKLALSLCAMLLMIGAVNPAAAQPPGAQVDRVQVDRVQADRSQAPALPPRQLDAAPGFEEDRPGAAPGFEKKQGALAEERDDHRERLRALAHGGAAVDLSDRAQRELLRERHGVTLEADGDELAFIGQFTRDPSEQPQLLVLDRERGELKLYDGPTVRARLLDLDLPEDETLEALGAPAPALPVRLVADGTLQLMVWRRARAPEHKTKKQDTKHTPRYHLTAYKVIGPYFGASLDREIAAGPSASPTPTAQISFARTKRHMRIIWTPVDDSGAPVRDRQEVLRWDRWEGVFRVPRPAPTAPRRDNPRT